MSSTDESSGSSPVIEFREVGYKLANQSLLCDISFSVSAGETLVLLGRSGAGKTTALKLINRLLTPTYGEIQVNSRSTISWDRRFQSTTLHQHVSLAPHGPPVFELSTEWKELGSGEKRSPFLKVAFDVRVSDPKLTIQIPYGAMEKPTDDGEYGAQKWADLAGADGGAAIINDCKHGYSAEKNE